MIHEQVQLNNRCHKSLNLEILANGKVSRRLRESSVLKILEAKTQKLEMDQIGTFRETRPKCFKLIMEPPLNDRKKLQQQPIVTVNSVE